MHNTKSVAARFSPPYGELRCTVSGPTDAACRARRLPRLRELFVAAALLANAGGLLAVAPAAADSTFARRNKLCAEIIITGKIANTPYRIYVSGTEGGGGGYIGTPITITTGPDNGNPTGSASVTIRHGEAEPVRPGHHIRTGDANNPNQPNDQQPAGFPVQFPTPPRAPVNPGFNPPQDIIIPEGATSGVNVLRETWNAGSIYELGLDPAQASWLNMGCAVSGTGDLQVQLLQCLPQRIIFQVVNDPTMTSLDNVVISNVGMQVAAGPCSGINVRLGFQGTSNVFRNGQFQMQITDPVLWDYARIAVNGPPPTIATPPQSLTICPTGAATFSVSAAGPGAYLHHWEWQRASGPWTPMNDGLNRDAAGQPQFDATGAFAAAVTLDPPAADTTYPVITWDVPLNARCVVTTGCGSVASAPAVMHITHPGDMNCDSAVNNFDIDAFVLALLNPAGYPAAYPGCNILNGDTNCDGPFNNFDIDSFVNLILGR